MLFHACHCKPLQGLASPCKSLQVFASPCKWMQVNVNTCKSTQAHTVQRQSQNQWKWKHCSTSLYKSIKKTSQCLSTQVNACIRKLMLAFASQCLYMQINARSCRSMRVRPSQSRFIQANVTARVATQTNAIPCMPVIASPCKALQGHASPCKSLQVHANECKST